MISILYRKEETLCTRSLQEVSDIVSAEKWIIMYDQEIWQNIDRMSLVIFLVYLFI